MKKLAIVCMCIMFFGCSGIKIDPVMKDYVIETAAMTASYEVGNNNKFLIDAAVGYCDAMLEDGITESAFKTALGLLLEHYKIHPVLQDRIVRLADFVTIDDAFDVEQATAVIRGFRDGLLLAKEDV